MPASNMRPIPPRPGRRAEVLTNVISDPYMQEYRWTADGTVINIPFDTASTRAASLSQDRLNQMYVDYQRIVYGNALGQGGTQKKSPKELNDEKRSKLKDEKARIAAIEKFKKTALALSDSEYVTAGIELTVMAMRENLMMYFKGDCIENLVSGGNVSLTSRLSTSGTHYYERREQQNQDVRFLKWKNVKVAKLTKQPEQIEFYPALFNRSVENQLVYDQIKSFLSEFLMGVQSKEDAESPLNLGFGHLTKAEDKQYMIDLAKSLSDSSRRGYTPFYIDEYNDYDDSESDEDPLF